MMHSEYMSKSQAAIHIVKSNVRYRGLNTGGGWIRHPTEVPEKFVARIASKIIGGQRSSEYTAAFDPVVYLREMAKLAKESDTGNCSELSALAFEYLRDQGVRPIDYFAVYRGSWNHAFVILNRDASIPVADFARWSEYAIVCDPLYDRTAIAGQLAPWYPQMFPLRSKDVMYRLE